MVKRYRPEEGTDVVDGLFTAEGSELVISRLGLVEAVSALALHVRMGELSIADYSVARKKFLGDIGQRKLQVVRLLVVHYRNAERLIDRHGKSRRLRTLDALQLSIALDLQQKGRIETFDCSDVALCELASAENLVTLNPLTN